MSELEAEIVLGLSRAKLPPRPRRFIQGLTLAARQTLAGRETLALTSRQCDWLMKLAVHKLPGSLEPRLVDAARCTLQRMGAV